VDPKQWKNQRDKIDKIYNLKIETIFKDQDYEVRKAPEEVGRTGHQIIFEIIPQKSKLPKFKGRWDGKDKNKELNIDILGVSKKQKKDFIYSKNRCCGHHVKKVYMNSNKKKYKPIIKFYGKRIYEGIISFNLRHNVTIGPTQKSYKAN